ncbi:DUF3370 domain-containing protein [Synechococcus sp. CS-1324]|uniref:DUF3370 domain-containing protein n=1 Tax=Synechococcus sp. CS-1324 TaxID=2847980 RepID=UPI00223C4C41|nr:DUF3370 domain-containing protein [Synechococcus sp. CS-1324]MCT0231391.1 DUF3370 domain-containing protein [Synechococcus sp. CS-1324]
MLRLLPGLLPALLPVLPAVFLTSFLPKAEAVAQPTSQPTSQPALSSTLSPTVWRPQQVRPLPGGLDRLLVVNDNNPELIIQPGILLSTFNGTGRLAGEAFQVPTAHLNLPLQGHFELFSHHVYAGRPEQLDSTLWLGVVAAPAGDRPVRLRLISGSTALSQSTDPSQPGAPFLPLPAVVAHDGSTAFSGPGSRVAAELLLNRRSPLFPSEWRLAADQLTTLVALPIPVKGLDPLLNGRNLQLRLESDGPVQIATLAAFGSDQPPDARTWASLLRGGLSPREHSPTPRGQKGGIIYSRVSGVQQGSRWRGQLIDPCPLQPCRAQLSVQSAPVSWPISSLERGSLGTGQVQTAELAAFYPGTAWAAHGNYGVEYDLGIPLINDTDRPVALDLAIESPRKSDQPKGGLSFNREPARPVMFRGTVEVSGLDGEAGRPSGRRWFHLVQRQGQQGPALGRISLAPGQRRQVRVRLIYPADATPPQVLSLLPAASVVKQSESVPAPRP